MQASKPATNHACCLATMPPQRQNYGITRLTHLTTGAVVPPASISTLASSSLLACHHHHHNQYNTNHNHNNNQHRERKVLLSVCGSLHRVASARKFATGLVYPVLSDHVRAALTSRGL